MKILCLLLVWVAAVTSQPPPPAGPGGPPPPPAGPAPEIDWGKCPQLQPSADEQRSKSKFVEECLKEFPPPTGELTREMVDAHRAKIADCGLKKEGWLNADGSYKFDKAEKELEDKKLDKEIQEKVLSQHRSCQKESETKFADDFSQQIPFYQACMDYHISEECGIKLISPSGPPAQP